MCPDYVDTTDKTPGVTTWEELLQFMGDLESWGHETLKGWKKDMAAIQKSKAVFKAVQVSKACTAEDMRHRALVQNKLAGICVEMCKEVGAYPEGCTCPNYTDTTDKTPNVVTWDELLGYIEKVETYGHEKNMEWTKKYSAIQSG